MPESARADPLEQLESSQNRFAHHDRFRLRHRARRLLRGWARPCRPPNPQLPSVPGVILPDFPEPHPRRTALAFLDEEDSFPPVATDPDDHRACRPNGSGCSWLRRLGAVAVGILILILLVLGIRGCLNARKERAFENYSRDLTTRRPGGAADQRGLLRALRRPGEPRASSSSRPRSGPTAATPSSWSQGRGARPAGRAGRGPGRGRGSRSSCAQTGCAAIADNIGAALGRRGPAEARDQIDAAHGGLPRQRRAVPAGAGRDQRRAPGHGISEDVPESQFFPGGPEGRPDIDVARSATVTESSPGSAARASVQTAACTDSGCRRS